MDIFIALKKYSDNFELNGKESKLGAVPFKGNARSLVRKLSFPR